MNLNNRGAYDPRLNTTLERPLASFNNCIIQLLDMKRGEQTAEGWDWRGITPADQSAEPEVLLTAEAQMQVFRFTLTMDGPVGSVDQYRTVRFTFSHKEQPDLRIRNGYVIRVISCPGNPTNETYQYIVNSGLNSGTSFRRTVETEVDMSRVWPG